ncbi:hypothetical protein PT2222_100222 [Paraburkholderia tropica]
MPEYGRIAGVLVKAAKPAGDAHARRA